MTDPGRPVALVGLPGVGKSSIGRRLARLLDRPFVDTDRAIEARAGCTVAELFEREGEAHFRALEHGMLLELLGRSRDADADPAEPGAVIATGGGIVLAPANRALLRASATTVYLQAAAAALVARLQHDTRRPLLQGPDLSQRLERLQAEREPLYREVASLVVDTRGSTVPRLAERIAEQLGAVPPT